MVALLVDDGFSERSARRSRIYTSFVDLDRCRRLPSGNCILSRSISLLMMLVVTFVSFLIHLYSTEFMSDDDGYSRFFAYMNLFVASMLTLVLANNLLLLYLGWEGVGLCSYLLIGFWYRDPANGAAGRKAFVVTRIGDTAMADRPVPAFPRSGHVSRSRNSCGGPRKTGT